MTFSSEAAASSGLAAEMTFEAAGPLPAASSGYAADLTHLLKCSITHSIESNFNKDINFDL